MTMTVQVWAPESTPSKPPLPRGPFYLAVALAAAAVGLGAALGPLVAAVVVGAGCMILAARSSEVVLHLLVASVFVESAALGDSSVRVGRVLAVLALLVVVARLSDRGAPHLPLWSWLPGTLYILWALTSAFWARDFVPWGIAMGQLGLAVCVFAAFAVLVRDEATVGRLMRTFACGALFASVLGVFNLGLLQNGSADRTAGLQGDANIYALYQAMAVPVAIALARRTRGGVKLFWSLATIPLAASVVASQSRGGLLTLVAVMAFVVFRRDEAFLPRRRRSAALFASAAVLAVVVMIAGAPLLARFNPNEVGADRASARLDIWHVAWGEFATHPATGIGAGNFKSHSIELLQQRPGVEIDSTNSLLRGQGIEVHNIYLEALTELGLPGLIGYLSIIGAAALALRRMGRRDPYSLAPVLAAMFVAFATGTVFLSLLNNKMLWFIVGCAAALSGAALREQRS